MQRKLSLLIAALLIGSSGSVYAQTKGTEPYNPNVFALDANRGNIRDEYFGVKISDLKSDGKGGYILNEQQKETVKKNILGKHMCSLQWISWDYFGTVTFSEDGDIIRCKGGQQSRENKNDHMKLDGVIEVVSPLHLKFTGKIEICIGKDSVTRDGTYNFMVFGARKYWRMQEMNNPKYECADYVDIYF